jgi:hypothetical protein
MTEIEKTKAEIEVLQKKLELLKEIETHKSQPRMEHQESGTVDKVEYNGHTYLRIDYDNDNDSWFGGVWWKQIERHKSPMNIVTDSETRNILEGLWFNQVKKSESTKPMDEVVERLIEKYESQKLWNRLSELGYSSSDCDEIIDLVEDWIPEPQNASGSQNVDTELLVDGFNHCLQKMKEMLR